MARPRKDVQLPFNPSLTPALSSWAEALGEALGRGVARGINVGMASVGPSVRVTSGAPLQLAASNPSARRRGRPPKALTGGPVPADRRCSVDGCGREARSKGLCSAHYQAERRRQRAKA